MKPTALALAALLSATALAGPVLAQAPAAFGAYKPQDDYSQQVVTSFYLPMRDGTKIAVSLHRPAVNGKAVDTPLPVIWHHTLDIEKAGLRDADPKAPTDRFSLPDLTRAGYVVAVVARRGNGASFGTRRGYEDFTEGFDAYEITEWLAAQPWSDGKVGMYGCSNTGEAVMHALIARPPHLKAAFAGCFAWERYDGHTRGGIISQYGTGPVRTLEDDLKATPVQGDEDRVQLRQAAEEHLKSTNLLELMKSMPYRDSWSPLVMAKFWGEVSIGAYLSQLKNGKVPLYIQGGWYDDFRTEGLIAQANLPDQARIVIGPWRHCLNDGFDLRAEQLRFFDHYLKGKTTGIEADAPIHYFTVGAPKGQEWRSARAWPRPDAANRLFLSADTLAPKAPTKAKASSVTVDYAPTCPPDPVKPNFGPFVQPCHPATASFVHTGPRLAADTEMTGTPLADLWISSTQPEQPVFAYLEDVAPDGTVTVISEGRQRASLRKVVPATWDTIGTPWRRSRTEDHQPLKAGEPVKVSFDMLAVSYVFKAGHRVRIAVSGAEPRERGRIETTPAPTLTLHTGGDTPSSVTLPFGTAR
ncbi:CocE/NonD family hydrolase [Caulobacter sp.]|uniref:CocE/NonD family hydrolase n=1 Tax=Caulobacter sp. TaxID=78 RepID=UPI001B248757|nr:CocE/NonD family hydrolase [Caulobacter sp.]MBO9544990.1 CocE/NonD family hydrolase [Caulobacter sp.]